MSEPTSADHPIAVPDGAEIFRAADDGGPVTPVALYAAQPGDVVVLPDRRRAGKYLGEGRMLLDVGEWAEFARLLDDPGS
ncbi:hypothetical protein BH09ACT8_BH09ACT8_53110 [soil metagenome]|jgi:hypothetical protein